MEPLPLHQGYHERRAITLSSEDIEAIAEAVVKLQGKSCPINQEELKNVLEFYQNMNGFFDSTKKTVWNTILVSFILGIIGLVSLGCWHKSGH